MRNALINCSNTIVSAIVGLMLVPALLRGLGAETYGLWITALTIAATATALDFGLEWCVARAVAASSPPEARKIAALTANATFWFATGCGLLIALAGFAIIPTLHLSLSGRQIAPWVFLIAGASFAADRVTSFFAGIMNGLHRFGRANSVMVMQTTTRAAGMFWLLSLHAGLLWIAGYYLVAAVLAAYASRRALSQIDPEFRFYFGRIDFPALRSHLEFGGLSELSLLSARLVWDGPVMLIGMLLGSAAVVPFHIAQRLPIGLTGLTNMAAAVAFPSASAHTSSNDLQANRRLLLSITRWILGATLPALALLWIFAAEILRLWVGTATPDMILVLRLMTLAVLADTSSAVAVQILWGSGAIRSIVSVSAAGAVIALPALAILIPRFGIVSAAATLAAIAVASSVVLILLAARQNEWRPLAALARIVFPPLLPTAVWVGVALLMRRYLPIGGVAGIALAAIVSTACYGLVFWNLAVPRKERRSLQIAAGNFIAGLSRYLFRRSSRPCQNSA